jgi:uncharacterized protein with GYD domain
MATFVTLINWTEQGIKNFRDSPKRGDAFRETVEKAGGRLVSVYWTIGEYDLVAVVEAPDDETFTALMLQVGSLGNIRTSSLRAFDQTEMERIIQKAG